MIDYQIQPNSRRCAATGKDLQPGERFYSALVEEERKLVRKDFSEASWQGPPAGAIGFWMGRVPTDADKFKPRFDDELLEDCFYRLEGQTEPGRLNFRYVVALLLVRRRRFRYETSVIEDGVEKMVLRCQRTQTKHEVVNPHLSDDEMTHAQDEVFSVLGWK